MKVLSSLLKIFCILFGLIIINACKKETNILQQTPLLAKTILGKWGIGEIKFVEKSGITKIQEPTIPIPIYNFLPNGFCGTNSSNADVVSYDVKNDTVINFSGDTYIESHQYIVKIINNNNDTTMEWIGYPPFTTRDGDPNLDHILISFNRSIPQ